MASFGYIRQHHTLPCEHGYGGRGETLVAAAHCGEIQDTTWGESALRGVKS